VIHAYLGYSIIALQKQLIGTALLIKEKSGNSTSITDSTHCISKATLCSGNNDVNHISEGLNSFDKQIKIGAHPFYIGLLWRYISQWSFRHNLQSLHTHLLSISATFYYPVSRQWIYNTGTTEV
jgi:hypothetical protein